MMKIAFLFSCLLAASPVIAAEPLDPTAVVHRYVQAWNDSDADALIALQDVGGKHYSPSQDAASLIGEVQAIPDTSAGRKQYYQDRFAKTPRVHVEIVGMQKVGDLVACRERITRLPEGGSTDALTIYRVQDGLVRNVWHVKNVAL